jgi:hypothetical protein
LKQRSGNLVIETAHCIERNKMTFPDITIGGGDVDKEKKDKTY